MIVVNKKDFFNPQNNPNVNNSIESGDFIIEVPELDFNQIGYAKSKEFGRELSLEEGLNYGYVEVVGIRCKCTRQEPLYWGLPDRKKYEFEVSFYIYEPTGRYEMKIMECSGLACFLKNTLPYINLLLREGYKIDEFNWEWIQWQVKGWEFSDANGQGRCYNLYENDITSKEALYDAVEAIVVSGVENGINHVGKDNDFWDEITAELKFGFPFVDRYLAELLFNTPEIDEENKIIRYQYRTNFHSDYASVGPYKLSEHAIKEYKYKLLRELRIYKIPKFSLEEMKKRRFLKL